MGPGACGGGDLTPIAGWLNKEEKGGERQRKPHFYDTPTGFPSFACQPYQLRHKTDVPSTQRTQGTTLRKARRGLPRSDSCFSPAWLEVKNTGFLLFGETY